MKYIINLIKTIIIYVLSTIIFGTLSYINIINEKTLNIIQLITIFITIFIISYLMGRKKEKKGYLEGMKYGLIVSLTFIIINILFKRKITKIKILYYLLILIISILGSIIGINKKTKA